nr:hypothetical protein [Tanacetum cinerariifolium]
QAGKKIVIGPQYVLLPLLTTDAQGPKSLKNEVADDAGKKSTKVLRKENGVQNPAKEEDTTDLQDTEIFSSAYDDKVKGAVADFNNLELTIVVSPIPTTRIHKDYPKEQIIRDPLLATQTK